MDISQWFMKKINYPWSIGVLNDGRVFFINEEEQYTTWIHPMYGHPVQTGYDDNNNLPKGWQFAFDSSRKKYYINHLEQYCTYETPNKYSNSSSKLNSVQQNHSNFTASTRLKKLPKAKRNLSIVPTLEGWLYKESGMIKTYRKKFCILSELCLFCYENSKTIEPTSSYILPGYSVGLHKVDHLMLKPFAFKIEHKNTKAICFIAESELERQTWVEALTKASTLQNNDENLNGQINNLVRRSSLNHLNSRLQSPLKNNNIMYNAIMNGHPQLRNSGSLPSINNSDNFRTKNWNSPDDPKQISNNNLLIPKDLAMQYNYAPRQTTFPETYKDSIGLLGIPNSQLDNLQRPNYDSHLKIESNHFQRSNINPMSRSSVNLNRISGLSSPLFLARDDSILSDRYLPNGVDKYINGRINTHSSEIYLHNVNSAFSPPQINNPRYNVVTKDDRTEIGQKYNFSPNSMDNNITKLTKIHNYLSNEKENFDNIGDSRLFPSNEYLHQNINQTQNVMNVYDDARRSLYTRPEIKHSNSSLVNKYTLLENDTVMPYQVQYNNKTNLSQSNSNNLYQNNLPTTHNNIKSNSNLNNIQPDANDSNKISYFNNSPDLASSTIKQQYNNGFNSFGSTRNSVSNSHLVPRIAAFDAIKEDPDMADDMLLTNRTLADVQQHMLSHARLRLSISVQDLGGKTHDELVLFLIQLKRSQKKLQEDLAWIKMARMQGVGDAAEEGRLIHQERDLTKQMEVTQPLINLLDNMITMGSLYNGEVFLYAAQYKKNPLQNGEEVPEKMMLTFSRRQQEQKLDQRLKHSQDADLGHLDEMLKLLHDLDVKMNTLNCQLLSLQDDKTMLSQTLLKLDEEARLSTDGIILRRLESQSAILRTEHSRVLQQIADTSIELEEAKHENQKIEQQVILMRSKLFDTSKLDPTSEHDSNLLVSQLEKEVSQMYLVMKNLTKQSDQIYNEMRNLKLQSDSDGNNKKFIDVKIPQYLNQNESSKNLQFAISNSPYSPVQDIYSIPIKKQMNASSNQINLLKEVNDLNKYRS